MARVDVQIEISDAVAEFLTENFPQKEPSVATISRVFSKNLIDNKPKWTLGTVYNFFKFIILRRDIEEFRDVVKYGRPVTALVLLDWVYVFENEKAVEKEKYASVPSTEKAKPETVDKFVKEIMSKIPKPEPPPPAIRPTQESDIKILTEFILGFNKEELLKTRKDLIVHSKIVKQENKKVEIFYYQKQIDLIDSILLMGNPKYKVIYIWKAEVITKEFTKVVDVMVAELKQEKLIDCPKDDYHRKIAIRNAGIDINLVKFDDSKIKVNWTRDRLLSDEELGL